MVFIQSYAVALRLTRCKSIKIVNLIARYCSKSSKLTPCIQHDITNNGAILKEIPNDQETAAYNSNLVKRLTCDVSVRNNINERINDPSTDVLKGDTDILDENLEDIDVKVPGPLDPCTEDVSNVGPALTPTCNFAKYADDSKVIQKLVEMGVELHKLEFDEEVMEMFLGFDYDHNIVPYLEFLHNCGVKPEHFGKFITRFPKIFKEDMDDLHTRIRYLRYHEFTPLMIQNMLTIHPPWLSFHTKAIDGRLSYFQSTYKLQKLQLRNLAARSPKLVTYKMSHIEKADFALRKQMGFNTVQLQDMLFTVPRIWIKAHSSVLRSFKYVYNQLCFSHDIIVKNPQLLLCRKQRIQARHEFLVQLGRNQYDPTKPLYVSPKALIMGSDEDFCKNIAKASIDTYDAFLKNY